MVRNRIATSTSFFLITLLLLITSPLARPAHAQLGDLGELLTAGQNDAQELLHAYLKPFAHGFGAGINSGWVDRARTHRVLGFHVKLTVSGAMVPEADRTFNVNKIGLQQLQVLSGSPETPTFSGVSSAGPTLGITEQGVDIVSFRMPQGTGLQFVPVPMVQAGIGLPRSTEVMVRFIPSVSFSDYGDISLMGAGFKHELNNWLPAGRLLPVTFSVMGAFTRFNASSPLDSRPSGNYENPQNLGGSQSAEWDNQKISLETDAYTVNLLVGRSLPILSVFAGVGYESSSTSVSVEGNYPYYVSTIDGNEVQRELRRLQDPVSLSYSGANSVRAMAGVRIRLALITLSADYTLAEYSMFTAGVGLSLR